MKLTYWYTPCHGDSDAYSFRTKTKRESTERLKGVYQPESYGEPRKVTVEYQDGLDLVVQCTDEGRLYWETETSP